MSRKQVSCFGRNHPHGAVRRWIFLRAKDFRGCRERPASIMMTGAFSFFGSFRLLFGVAQTEKQILKPLAVVVFGGMLASTLLDQIVTPALFLRFGARVFQKDFDLNFVDHDMERRGEAWFPTRESNRQVATAIHQHLA